MQSLIKTITGVRRVPKLAMVVLASLCAIGVAEAVSSSAAVIAAGSGHNLEDAGPRKFTFVAVEHSDGSINGQAHLRTHVEDEAGEIHTVTIHIQVDDAVAFGDGMAVVTGYVTKSDDTGPFALLDGWSIGFVVMDTGAGLAADEISHVFGWAPEPTPGLAHFLVDSGFVAFLVDDLRPIDNGEINVF